MIRTRLLRFAAPVCLVAATAPVGTGSLAPLAAQEGDADADTLRVDADTLPHAPRFRTEELRVIVTRSGDRELDAPFALSVLEPDARSVAERHVSLQEPLRGIPGVLVQNRRNFSLGDRIVLRGAGARAQFGVRGVKILADGIPLTMPDGQAALTNLDLASAGRIEVIRGPASALYGNASGGVIRVESGGFATGDPIVAPRLLAGSHGLRRGELRASGTAGGTDLLLGATALRTDGFREHAAAELYRANLIGRRDVAGGGEIRAVLNVYTSPFAENPSSLTLEDALERPRTARPLIIEQGAGQSTTQAQAGISLRLPVRDSGRVEAAVWGLGRGIRNPIPFRIIDLDRRAAGARLSYRDAVRAGDLPLRWTVGIDAGLQRDDRRESANLGVPDGGERARAGETLLDQRERVTSLAPFLQVEVEPVPGWQVSAAGRVDLYRFAADDRLLADGDDSGSRRLEELSPVLGTTWRARPELALYANLATAFQTPTTSELSNRPDGAGGFHPDLEPERTRSVELGARGRVASAALAYDLALYDARVRDALLPFEGPGEQVFFRNAGESRRRGAEGRLEWFPGAGLELELAVTLQAFTFLRFETGEGDFAGNREPGVPGHRVFASLGWSPPRGPGVELALTRTAGYPVNDANTARNPAHEVVDLRLVWPTDPGGRDGWSVRPFLGIDNLFDTRYNAAVTPNAFGDRYYEPAPGRELYAGARVQLPGGR